MLAICWKSTKHDKRGCTENPCGISNYENNSVCIDKKESRDY